MSTNEWQALIEHMRKTLLGAIKERPKRQEVVAVPGGTELAWVVFEREQMLAAVNTERTHRGLPPISTQDVARVEHQAMGHSDYVKKYALGCAELVTQEGR